MTPSSNSRSRIPVPAKRAAPSLPGVFPGENNTPNLMAPSSPVLSGPPIPTASEDFPLPDLLDEPPKSPEQHMGMDIDPSGPSTLGLADALPPIVPKRQRTAAASKPTTGSSTPSTAAPPSDRPDLSQMSEKERKAWRLSMLDQRRNERNARLRAEEAQKKLDQAEREKDQPLPQAGDKRPHRAGSSPPPRQIASAMQEDVGTDAPHRDLTEIISLPSTKCAIQLDDGPIVGSPLAVQAGFGFNVSIDAGRFGEPKLTLGIKVANGPKNVDLNKLDRDQISTFSVDWIPGMFVSGSALLVDCEIVAVAAFPDSNVLAPKKITKNLSEGKLRNLVCICIQMRASLLSAHKPFGLEGLSSEVKQTIKALGAAAINRDSSLAIWCIPGQRIDLLQDRCFSYFTEAVKEGLVPLHQYCDERGVMSLDLRSTEPIRTFYNGMYCKWDKNQNRDDKNAVPHQYFTLPRKLVWDQVRQFNIYGDIAVIREAQFAEGQTALITERRHRIFLEEMPLFHGVDPGNKKTWSKLTREQRRYRLSYYGYVRITPDRNSAKEQPPPVNSSVQVEFYNPDAQGNHQSIEGRTWYGTVIHCEEELLRQTGADFCIHVTRPYSVEPRIKFDAPRYVPNDGLPQVYIKPTFNQGPAVRELTAFNAFCRSPKLQIDALRSALCSVPYRGDRPVVDLSLGPDKNPLHKALWDAFLQWLDTASSNEAQDDVIRSAMHMRDGISIVVGPPGTGKTDTIQRLIWLLVQLGHIVLVTAASNVAVDNAATAIYREKRVDTSGEDYKFLRLEIDSVELEASLLRTDYDDDNADLDKPLDYSTPSHTDDPAVVHVLEKLDIDYGTHQLEFEKYFEQEGNIKKAYQLLRQRVRRLGGDYPRAYSLDWRLWELGFRLRQNAQQDYDAEIARYSADPVGLSNLMQNGKIKTVDERDPSSTYRRYNEMYREKGGTMPRAAQNAYKKARRDMTRMVFEESKVILVTLNHSGSKTLRSAFKPTVIVMDEAGQASVPAVSVPLTSFSSWQGLFMFGDPEQLKPTVISARANEGAEFAKLSPLHLLMQKEYPHIFLNVQYRMCPAISSFPARHFYNGRLRDAHVTSLDNEIRQAMRTVSRTHYNIEGPDGEGSEYWFVDVKHGNAWLETGGSSLQNWANADAITTAMDRCVSAGISAENINVLTLYQGQRKLVLTKIRAKATADAQGTSPEEVARNWAIGDVCIVDSFQGRQAPVVFLDIVATGADVNDSLGSSHMYGHITSFVRSSNRLNVAITRPQWGLIVFGKKASVTTKARPAATDMKQSLALLVWDAVDRNLVAEDTQHVDTHPAGIQRRQVIEARTRAVQKEQDRVNKLSFISRMQQQQH